MKIWVFIILSVSLFLGYLFFVNKDLLIRQSPQELFVSEVYDTIKANYWEKIDDQKLSGLFFLAAGKLESTPSGKVQSKPEVIRLVRNKDKDFVTKLVNIVLANLQPFGRSGLYTQKLEVQLKNTVDNVNPQKDLYKDLGLPKNASAAAVEQAYNNLPQEKKKDKEIAYAKDTLTNKDTKARYDQNKVEPTIFTKILPGNIAYLQFKKFSPTSLEEFQKGLNSFDTNTLIFDLRGNIGGAIDETAYFLGNFIGANQYAFDFFHQGTVTPFKTNLDSLPVIKRFKTIVILIDNQTQSSAELMAAGLKRYKKGVLVGVPTRGWGTVERVFPLEHQIDSSEKYSVFLVHSITLRDDNLPIEGRGVEPNVNIKDPSWESQLNSLIKNPELTYQTKKILTQ